MSPQSEEELEKKHESLNTDLQKLLDELIITRKQLSSQLKECENYIEALEWKLT